MNRRWLLLIVLVVGVVWFVKGGGQSRVAPHPTTAPNTIVAYTAKWCVNCQHDKPYLAELERRGWKVEFIDIDAAGVSMTIPAYFVYKNGWPLFNTHNVREIQ